jgi:hypothetical protein
VLTNKSFPFSKNSKFLKSVLELLCYPILDFFQQLFSLLE